MFSKNFKNRLLLNILLLSVFQKPSIAVTPADQSSLKLYYGPDFKDSTTYQLADAANILDDSNFKSGDTHIYIHGWQEDQDSDDIHTIVDAYLQRDDINLIALDWGKAASESYDMASFSNIELIAPVLSDAITDLYDAGLDRNTVTVVGYGLGAQLAGLTGRSMIMKSNGSESIANMAVLDAKSLYFGAFPPEMITVDRNDADFVQAIHTNGGMLGQPEPLGHVDFFPNGGTLQPGCGPPPQMGGGPPPFGPMGPGPMGPGPMGPGPMGPGPMGPGPMGPGPMGPGPMGPGPMGPGPMGPGPMGPGPMGPGPMGPGPMGPGPMGPGPMGPGPMGPGPMGPGPEGPPPPPQPEPQDFCSHHRSWMFWAESVARTNETYPKFLGYPSVTYELFKAEGLDNQGKMTIEMGIDCPKNANGTYFLTTNAASLFARGEDGFYYDPVL